MIFKFVPNGKIPCEVSVNPKGVLEFNEDGMIDVSSSKEIRLLQSIVGITDPELEAETSDEDIVVSDISEDVQIVKRGRKPKESPELEAETSDVE